MTEWQKKVADVVDICERGQRNAVKDMVTGGLAVVGGIALAISGIIRKTKYKEREYASIHMFNLEEQGWHPATEELNKEKS